MHRSRACVGALLSFFLSLSIQAHAYTNLWRTLSAHCHLPIPIEKAAIQKQIQWYLAHKSALEKMMAYAEPYIFYVYEQTRIRKLPAELALLPFIESEYNPFAFSNAGATGLWQLMPGTATGFGLTINWWYDGRRDIKASTQAALDYLTYLYHFLGKDWLLAIAAYNSGEGAMRQAIKNNRLHHESTHFWSLALPKETLDYLPKLLALVAIVHNPDAYQVQLPAIPNRPYFTSVELPVQMDFDQLSQLSDLSEQTLHRLNAGYRRRVIGPDGTQPMLVPKAQVGSIKARLMAWKKEMLAGKHAHIVWRHYRVKDGDTLGNIARMYHTNWHFIQKSNGIHGVLIRKGDDLIIPNPMHAPKKWCIHPMITRKPTLMNEDHLPGPKAIIHTVKDKETLESIAKRHHLSVGHILFWNQLSYRHQLKAGTELVLWR